jgi:hypothetical protein
MAQLLGCDYCGQAIEPGETYISFPVYQMVPVDNRSNYPPGSIASQGVNLDTSSYQPQQIDQRDYHVEHWAIVGAKEGPVPTVTATAPAEAPSSDVSTDAATEAIPAKQPSRLVEPTEEIERAQEEGPTPMIEGDKEA